MSPFERLLSGRRSPRFGDATGQFACIRQRSRMTRRVLVGINRFAIVDT
jgi:hypothetical protein